MILRKLKKKLLPSLNSEKLPVMISIIIKCAGL
jgi:hypothetical protein